MLNTKSLSNFVIASYLLCSAYSHLAALKTSNKSVEKYGSTSHSSETMDLLQDHWRAAAPYPSTSTATVQLANPQYETAVGLVNKRLVGILVRLREILHKIGVSVTQLLFGRRRRHRVNFGELGNTEDADSRSMVLRNSTSIDGCEELRKRRRRWRIFGRSKREEAVELECIAREKQRQRDEINQENFETEVVWRTKIEDSSADEKSLDDRMFNGSSDSVSSSLSNSGGSNSRRKRGDDKNKPRSSDRKGGGGILSAFLSPSSSSSLVKDASYVSSRTVSAVQWGNYVPTKKELESLAYLNLKRTSEVSRGSHGVSPWLHEASDVELLRFLRAKSGNRDDAWKMILTHAKWRVSAYGADTIVRENKFLGSALHREVFWLGVSKGGCPTMIVRTRAHDGADYNEDPKIFTR
jgi:hypothetical protein